MAEAKEVLEIMKEVAILRIAMLREGITFHDSERRNYFLQCYEQKLGEINRQIRRLNLRLVRPNDKTVQ
ncbi:hypothetical protein GURASL_20100 [Geotalea uraniireducens]|uniref:Uncharacterized protein n=1 Tax=Geotalea uraniireducens TaxID=351604 RepID=A0ABN6VUE4_9BACT|nr:hypothetical protein [Geotalea uraniireducens]BDV43087.1 hypothetical protein GURASL_20100 [Geotalea uraniireducens]